MSSEIPAEVVVQRMAQMFEARGVTRRHFLRLVAQTAGVAAMGPVLAACAPSPQAAAPAAPKAAASPTAALSAGVEPQVLVYGGNQDISNLDPSTGHDYSIGSAQKACYDSLFQYINNPPELSKVLCTDYEVSPDAKVWTFKLDPRARFHDGNPLTADDVVYSVQRMLRKKKGAAWMWLDIMDESSATAVDAHTVKITLSKPFAPLALTLPWLFIVNKQVALANEANGDEGEAYLRDHEAGSGPFTIKRWEIGTLYEFEAVPDYWRGWREEGRLAGFIWKIMRESTSKKIALEKGEVDFADWMSADDIKLLQEEPEMHVSDVPGINSFSVKLNNQRGYTADLHVRRALNYALDYQAVIDALQGWADLLEGPVPSNVPGHAKGLKVYRYDMEKAKEELAQSQWPDGGFELEYVYVTGIVIEERIGLILLDNLGKLGIKVNMKPMVWPDMVARFAKVETAPDTAAVYLGNDYAHADNYLFQAFHSSQAGTWSAASHYKNPQVDAWIEEARSTVDEEKQNELYAKVQQQVLDDAAEVFVHNEKPVYAWRDNVKGYDNCPVMSVWFYPLYKV